MEDGCILSKFYIKPQLPASITQLIPSCILSKFYIKPQLGNDPIDVHSVVSYRNSTSNHNIICDRYKWRMVVSYRNSTSNHNGLRLRYRRVLLYLIEILHQTTTMNSFTSVSMSLYLIEILHQTTTILRAAVKNDRLYLIEILHQTTTKRPSG